MKILELLFPETCVYCGEIIRNGCLCPECFKQLDPLFVNKENENGILCVYNYDYDYIPRIVMTLKRTGSKTLANFMTEKICALLRQTIPDIKDYTITYTPRKLSNKLANGVDQSKILARLCAEKLDCSFAQLIKRRLFSKEQKNLNLEQRIKNVKGIFKATPLNCETPKKIIILDDVSTTGSTLFEAKNTLLSEYGADNVCIKLVTFSSTNA